MHLRTNPDGTLTLFGSTDQLGWSETLTPGQLPDRLTFYRRLRDRGSKTAGTPGPWGHHYAPTVTALEHAIATQGNPKLF